MATRTVKPNPKDELFDNANNTHSTKETLVMAEETIKQNETVELDTDDIPDFGGGDDSEDSDNSPRSGAPSLEELNFKINREEVEKDRKELFLPSGDYCFVGKDELKITQSIIERDKHPKDINPRGRTIFNVSGKVESKDGQSGGFFRLGFSPDKRYVKDRDGNLVEPVVLDNLFKAFLEVDRFYFLVKEKNAEESQQGWFIAVQELLQTKRYYMYISKGKNGGNYFNQLKEMD